MLRSFRGHAARRAGWRAILIAESSGRILAGRKAGALRWRVRQGIQPPSINRPANPRPIRTGRGISGSDVSEAYTSEQRPREAVRSSCGDLEGRGRGTGGRFRRAFRADEPGAGEDPGCVGWARSPLQLRHFGGDGQDGEVSDHAFPDRERDTGFGSFCDVASHGSGCSQVGGQNSSMRSRRVMTSADTPNRRPM